MKHSLLTHLDSLGVDLVEAELCDIVELDEVGISENIAFFLGFGHLFVVGVEDRDYGLGVDKGDGFAELLPELGVLIKLSHFKFNITYFE